MKKILLFTFLDLIVLVAGAYFSWDYLSMLSEDKEVSEPIAYVEGANYYDVRGDSMSGIIENGELMKIGDNTIE